MILREAPREHYAWIAERAGIGIVPCFSAIEAVEGDRILAMVGFDGVEDNSCLMHVALEDSHTGRRAGVELIRPAFDLVFNKAKRGVVVATVLSTNAKALRLNRHLGFREVFVGRDWHAKGVDTVWMEMRREECRWLKEA